jgi:hypothetical protein
MPQHYAYIGISHGDFHVIAGGPEMDVCSVEILTADCRVRPVSSTGIFEHQVSEITLPTIHVSVICYSKRKK